MIDARWREEKDQIIELLYRVQADHGGRLLESEALEIGPWVADAAKRAQRLWCLVAKGSPPVLTVTYGGRKALEAALASREEAGSQPYLFGGSVVPVETEYGGPVVLPLTYEPYNKLKERALEQGVLTQEDIDRVARSPRMEPEEPEEFRMLEELSFPGTRWFFAPLQYEDGHPLGGGLIDPAGHEGPYQVTATLTRRGAPDVPYMYTTDAYSMEGDSHLRLPEKRREDGAVGVLSIVYTSREGEQTQFELLANRQGRLGQIRTVLRAKGADDARRTAYRLLNPFLCDLSYRYDVPVEFLQMNVVELATLTVGGMKQDDFREKAFDPEAFLGSGIDYRGELPNYEFFTRLYREGANSSSVDYGFLCFFRIAEGVIRLRRERVMELEGKSWRDVRGLDVFSEGEVVEDDEDDSPFPPEKKGASLREVYKELRNERHKVGHAFLDDEDPVGGYEDIIVDRLKGEEDAGTRRAQARYLARRMLRSEFWASDKSEEAESPTS